ncbi:MAG: ATP-binding protein [Pseudanabaenaceae cyanobacterium]|jgi:signal transduction histidine kinase
MTISAWHSTRYSTWQMVNEKNNSRKVVNSRELDKARELSKKAKELADAGNLQGAIALFEQALSTKPNDQLILTSYAKLMRKAGRFKEAIRLLEKSISINPNNLKTIIEYSKTLNNQKKYDESLAYLDHRLKVTPENLKLVKLLDVYANTAVDGRMYDKASELFERSLQLDCHNNKTLIRTLNSFGKLLMHQQEYQRAAELFRRAILIYSEDNDHKLKEESFERAFLQGNKNYGLINNYINALMRLEKYQNIIELFENSLQDCNDLLALNYYLNSLARQGKYLQSFYLFTNAIKKGENDYETIDKCASDLNESGLWQGLVELRPDVPYFRRRYAHELENNRKYEEAIYQLLEINLEKENGSHSKSRILVDLGRLYYRSKKFEKGMQLITEAITISNEQDRTTLYAAQSLLKADQNSQEAINLLLKIREESPFYAEAMKAITLNADEETYYELFGANEEQIDDIEMLYRAMYHKIGNEIAVLRSISYRLLKRLEGEHPLVKEIINELEKLQQGIANQRANEKAAIAKIPHSNYKQLIEIVSKTAHDISDEVNNQLAVVESKTRRAMRKLMTENPQYQQFEKLLLQLKITQTALNDLKSINEGKTIRRDRFLVHRLFEKWEPENWTSQPRTDGAWISLDIRNPHSEFNGDEEKIKSILNELVENSLKHNHGNPNLSICMTSSDVLNPQDISSPTIPGDRKFLYIEFKDNGQGITGDKKDWIFQPLKTTSPEDKGSGLGLFIARKTIRKMGGQIREVGEAGQGVRFQIYLPYL